MKLKFKYIMALVPALLLLAGCMQKEQDFGQQDKVLTARLESAGDTRVSFDKDGKFSWNTGDKIAVFVGSAYVHDIAVEPSTGRISVNGSRSRYAVYPSDVADDSNTGSPTLNVILPSGYDITDIVSGGSGSDAYAPGDDYSPMPMVAENNPMEDVLFFRHVGGLLRYKWINLPAGTKTVTFAFDTDVTGTYGVDLVDITNPTITTAGTASNNVVTFKVSESGLAAAKTVVFNIPVPVGHYGSVTVAAYAAAPTGTGSQLAPPSATPTSTKTFTDGTDVKLVFERHWGRMLASDGTFTYFIDGLEDVTVEYTGGAPELAREFYSYKTDGRDKFPVPFVLEYSADGTTGWTTTAPSWLTMDTNDDFGGSTDALFLRVNISEQQNQAVDQHALDLRNPALHPHQGTPGHPFNLATVNVATGTTVSATSANCYVVQAPGYYMFPLVYGNTLKNGSALQYSYVSLKETTTDYTQSSGRTWRYDDRIVYSSQHDNYNPEGEKSVEKYWRTIKTETVHPHSFWYMGCFRDHKDKPIVRGKPSSINSVPNSTTYNDNSHWFNIRFAGKTLTAKIIWTDAEGLVTDAYVDVSNTYLIFTVPESTICQGNAMIALLVDGEIAWSWHIWVTDADLTARKAGSNSYEFAPVNIGWCDPKEVEKREERKVYVRARQSITGVLDADNYSNTVLVTSKAGQYIKIGGHSPYYQWGRKDPLASAYLKTIVTKDGTTVGPVEKPYIYHPDYASVEKEVGGEWVSIGTAIQHPYIRYYYNGTDAHGWNWTTSWIINLWNSLINGYGESYSGGTATSKDIVLKTIYDPSPVGYTVPPRAAYSGFNSSNFLNETIDGDTGRTYNGNLFFPNVGYYAGSGKYLYDFAKYWSASTEGLCGDYREEYVLSFTSDYPYTLSSAGQQMGLPIRPVKDVAAF